MAGRIFINYRRGDDPQAAGRIFDRLEEVFESHQLFLDVDNIAPGLDFVSELNKYVAECDVLLAVIGKSWIDARDAGGARRLDDANDFVRIEIASALRQQKRVIPVLIGDALMPRADELPEELKPLVRRNAVRLTHERFRADVQGLVRALQQTLREIEEQRQHQAETEAQRRAEEEQQRKAIELETARRDEEDRQRREAEAARRDEEDRQRREVEAARRAEEDRKRREAEAARRAEEAELARLAEQEEQAFAAARRANSIAAIDAFLASHRQGRFGDEAQKIKLTLQAREEAHRRAMLSDDPLVLKSFCDEYRKGVDVDRARQRLRLLDPRQKRQAGPGTFIAAALALLVIGVAIAWAELRPSASVPEASPTASAAPEPAKSAAVQGTQAEGAHAPDAKTKVADLPPPAPVTAPTPNPDATAWAALKDSDDTSALANFIAQFPDSPFRKDAEERIAWNLVKDSNDPDPLRRFIDEFPNSPERAQAEQRIASLPAVSKPAAVSPPDPHALTRSLQVELARVGCFNGAANGDLDDATKTALARFIKLTSLGIPDDVSTDTLNAVRGINKRVCPLVCPHGEHAEGEACVANEALRPKHVAKPASTRAPEPRDEAAPAAASNAAPAARAGLGCRGRGAGGRGTHILPDGQCGY